MSHYKSNLIAVLVCCLGISVGVLGCSITELQEDSTRSWEQARQAALDGIHRGAGLGEDYMLRAVPTVATAETYGLGSVFKASTYPLRYTSACVFDDVNAAVDLSRTFSGDVGNEFSLSLKIPPRILESIPLVDGLEAAINANAQATFGYEYGAGQTVDVRSAYDQLETLECLADIANQDVWVLVATFEMKEVYRAGNKLGVEAGVTLAGPTSLEVKIGSEQKNFEARDARFSRRAWAFLPYMISIEGFNANANRASRLAVVEDFLGGFEGAEEEVSRSVPKLNPALLDDFFMRGGS